MSLLNSGRQRYSISIRAKLLVASLAFLLIPWLGYTYVKDMKSFLLQGQANALLLTSRAIATVLHEHDEFFSPFTGVEKYIGRDLDQFAYPAPNLIRLDGRVNDWGELLENAKRYTTDGQLHCTASHQPSSLSYRHLLAYHGPYIYALFIVDDDSLVSRDNRYRRLDASDHIRITLSGKNDDVQRYLLTGADDGWLSTYLADKDWIYPVTGLPDYDVTGVRRRITGGYIIEARILRKLISTDTRVSFALADVDDGWRRVVERVISSAAPQAQPGTRSGRLLLHSPEIAKTLRGLDYSRGRITILDDQRRIRARIGKLSGPHAPQTVPTPPMHWWQKLATGIAGMFLRQPAASFTELSDNTTYRDEALFNQVYAGEPLVLRRPSLDRQAQILVAAHPIWVNNRIQGAVIVEQSSNNILSLQHHVLENVIATTFIVFLLVALTLIVFATRLAWRIRRLRNSAEEVIGPKGELLETRQLPEAGSRDELGDLSRGISSVLERLGQHTRYLERIPGTLAHELSNPLNVVTSSLDNLDRADCTAQQAHTYIKRARHGIERLSAIVRNLTEAAHLDDALRSGHMRTVNMNELVEGCVEGYRIAHADRDFHLRLHGQALYIRGEPDYLAQLLDKLVDNAIDFSKEQSAILIALERQNGNTVLSVANRGPLLPDTAPERLFEPMVSIGKKHAGQSHLGLGLYIVRLISEFHQGSVSARNLPDDRGVEFSVQIPCQTGEPAGNGQ
jgi:dedicated sortase system histidine kinase